MPLRKFVQLLMFPLLVGVFALGCQPKKPKDQQPPDPGKPGGVVKVDSTVKQGEKLVKAKGCFACHTADGTRKIGPTFKGLYGSKKTVITNGKERVITVDDAYLVRSIKDPNADIVKGYSNVKMVAIPVSAGEMQAMVAYLKAMEELESHKDRIAESKGGKGLYLIKARGCATCHSLDGSKKVAPTFAGIFGRKEKVVSGDTTKTITVDEAYLRKSILSPDAEVVKGYHKGMMPTVALTSSEVDSIVGFLKTYKGTKSPGTAEPLTSKEKKIASRIYFDRCAGCHGMLRKGATGPALLPDGRIKKIGVSGIKTFVTYGLPGGMPALGKSGVLKPEEIELVARFLQLEPPAPPELDMKKMRSSWKLHVPVARRPKKPMHKYNWKNFIGVVLRDAGKVAIIDGDTKKLVTVINTGFAVHILRSSATGRYFYSIGRDGKVTMIDLWMKTPKLVAEVKSCYDARSIDSSKYKGPKGNYLDKLLVVGCYWPPSIAVVDGLTLEPKKIVSTSGYTVDTNEYLREARVAAIIASHHDPEWIINIKETGYIWIVDYTNVDALRITTIAADRFLHDGGFDISKRYVLMAANARNKVAVVDLKTKKLVALVKTGIKPHPGRGANWRHPKYGPIWCTGHLGDNTIACIGTDPDKHKQYAWKVVARAIMPDAGGGNLFVKTHPKSKYLWADRTLHPKAKHYRSVFVFDRVTFKFIKQLTVPKKFPGRAVHMEYSMDGSEVYVSAWSPKNKKSALLVYDDKTLTLKHTITGDWLVTPTGKWNVYNTFKDIY